jgi:hypothetical protein
MANLSAGAAANLLMAMVAVAPVRRTSSSAANCRTASVCSDRQAKAEKSSRHVSDEV